MAFSKTVSYTDDEVDFIMDPYSPYNRVDIVDGKGMVEITVQEKVKPSLYTMSRNTMLELDEKTELSEDLIGDNWPRNGIMLIKMLANCRYNPMIVSYKAPMMFGRNHGILEKPILLGDFLSDALCNLYHHPTRYAVFAQFTVPSSTATNAHAILLNFDDGQSLELHINSYGNNMLLPMYASCAFHGPVDYSIFPGFMDGLIELSLLDEEDLRKDGYDHHTMHDPLVETWVYSEGNFDYPREYFGPVPHFYAYLDLEALTCRQNINSDPDTINVLERIIAEKYPALPRKHIYELCLSLFNPYEQASKERRELPLRGPLPTLEVLFEDLPIVVPQMGLVELITDGIDALKSFFRSTFGKIIEYVSSIFPSVGDLSIFFEEMRSAIWDFVAPHTYLTTDQMKTILLLCVIAAMASLIGAALGKSVVVAILAFFSITVVSPLYGLVMDLWQALVGPLDSNVYVIIMTLVYSMFRMIAPTVPLVFSKLTVGQWFTKMLLPQCMQDIFIKACPASAERFILINSKWRLQYDIATELLADLAELPINRDHMEFIESSFEQIKDVSDLNASQRQYAQAVVDRVSLALQRAKGTVDLITPIVILVQTDPTTAQIMAMSLASTFQRPGDNRNSACHLSITDDIDKYTPVGLYVTPTSASRTVHWVLEKQAAGSPYYPITLVVFDEDTIMPSIQDQNVVVIVKGDDSNYIMSKPSDIVHGLSISLTIHALSDHIRAQKRLIYIPEPTVEDTKMANTMIKSFAAMAALFAVQYAIVAGIRSLIGSVEPQYVSRPRAEKPKVLKPRVPVPIVTPQMRQPVPDLLRIQRNVVSISRDDEIGTCHGFLLDSQTLVFSRHIVDFSEERPHGPDREYTITITTDDSVSVHKRRLAYTSIASTEDDVSVVFLVPPIIGIESIRDLYGVGADPDDDVVRIHQDTVCHAVCTYVGSFTYDRPINGRTRHMTGYAYNRIGKQGFCGLPVAVMKRGRATIFAIHSGSDTTSSWATRVPRIGSPPHIVRPIEFPDLPDEYRIPQTNTIPIGSCDYQHINTKTRMCATSIDGGLVAPAQLSKDVLYARCIKYEAVQPEPPFEDQDYAAQVAIRHYNSITTDVERRRMTFEEVFDDITASGTWSHSAGYGMGLREDHRRDGQFTPAFKSRVTNLLDRMASGEIVYPIAVSHLKDETLALAKVQIGRTRIFEVFPFDFFVAGKILIGKYHQHMLAAQSRCFSKMGMNVDSGEWNVMVQDLLGFSKNRFDCDISNNDGDMPLWMSKVWLDVLQDFYGDDPAIVSLEYGMFTSYMAIENTLYTRHQGNPSGRVCTTDLNAIAQMTYIAIAFRRTFEGATVDDFFRHIKLLSYGDDNVTAISDELADAGFNFLTLRSHAAELGIKLTPGTKDKEPEKFLAIEELSFLKRAFAFSPELGIWVPFVTYQTILNQLSFCRDPSIDGLRALCLSVCRTYWWRGNSRIQRKEPFHVDTSQPTYDDLKRMVFKELGVDIPSWSSMRADMMRYSGGDNIMSREIEPPHIAYDKIDRPAKSTRVTVVKAEMLTALGGLSQRVAQTAIEVISLGKPQFLTSKKQQIQHNMVHVTTPDMKQCFGLLLDHETLVVPTSILGDRELSINSSVYQFSRSVSVVDLHIGSDISVVRIPSVASSSIIRSIRSIINFDHIIPNGTVAEVISRRRQVAVRCYMPRTPKTYDYELTPITAGDLGSPLIYSTEYTTTIIGMCIGEGKAATIPARQVLTACTTQIDRKFFLANQGTVEYDSELMY